MSDPRGLLTADAATWAGYAFMLGATLKLVHVAPEICADIYRGVTAAMQFGVLVVLFLGTMVYIGSHLPKVRPQQGRRSI